MKALSLQTLATLSGGKLVHGDGTQTCHTVSTDSRKISPGTVFVALVGEKFDAHDFLSQVAEAGATAVLVSRVPENVATLGCGVIEVEDTLLALQTLARAHRQLLDPLIIAITGSNGKTSTKDLTAAILRKKYDLSATAGNLNNHIGVPLTLLAMNESQNGGVVEMGMNHFGEIATLAKIALPNAAIITNIGIAHIEYMGSREGIAQEKGTLAEAIPADGVVILNANDDFSPSIAARSKAKILTAGIGKGDIKATILESNTDGSRFTLDFEGKVELEISMPVVGEHMVANAALAAACGWHFGVDPQDIAIALNDVELTKGRLQIKRINGVTFVDDSYNANPDSMRAGLKALSSMSVEGRRVAVLGRMGELGIHAEEGHRQVGEAAAQADLSALLTVGSGEAALIGESAVRKASHLMHQHFMSQEDCAAFLKTWVKKGDTVLLKGSRSAAMEKVLTYFETP